MLYSPVIPPSFSPMQSNRVGPLRLLAAVPRWVLPGLLVLSFVTATLALGHRDVWRDQYDDAYITFRYARNLAIGKGLVFNTYERVNSASSFLYTVVLAGAYRLGVHDLERLAAAFGIVMGAILIVETFLLACAVTGRRAAAFFFTAPLCFTGSIGAWAVSGMETIFFAALVIAFLRRYLFYDRSKWSSFALLGLILLCRVEGAILLALVGVREILASRRSGRSRDLVLLGALAVLPTVGLLIFNGLYYGAPLPHPLYLKRVSVFYSPPFIDQALGVVGYHVIYYAGYLLLAGVAMWSALAALRRDPRIDPPPVLFLTLYLALSAASILVGPYSDSHRYAVHCLPVLAVLALVGGLTLRPPRARDFAPAAAVAALAGGALWNGVVTARWLDTAAEHQQARRQMGEWLNRNTRPGDRIASTDLGEVAYVAQDRDFVDVFGLTSADFAELSQTAPERSPALFAGLQPAYIADTAFPRPGAASADGAALWTRTEKILATPASEFHLEGRAATTSPLPFTRKQVLSISKGGCDFAIVQIGWPAGGLKVTTP